MQRLGANQPWQFAYSSDRDALDPVAQAHCDAEGWVVRSVVGDHQALVRETHRKSRFR